MAQENRSTLSKRFATFITKICTIKWQLIFLVALFFPISVFPDLASLQEFYVRSAIVTAAILLDQKLGHLLDNDFTHRIFGLMNEAMTDIFRLFCRGVIYFLAAFWLAEFALESTTLL